MKSFVDTSVVVAAFQETHIHHQASFSLFEKMQKTAWAVAAHSLAEIYSNLTRMPGKDRVGSEEALLFLADVRDRSQIVALSEDEQFNAIEMFAAAGILGGAIYDALIAACAIKAKAKILYTWNIRDFKRLESIGQFHVRTPDEF